MAFQRLGILGLEPSLSTNTPYSFMGKLYVLAANATDAGISRTVVKNSHNRQVFRDAAGGKLYPA